MSAVVDGEGGNRHIGRVYKTQPWEQPRWRSCGEAESDLHKPMLLLQTSGF